MIGYTDASVNANGISLHSYVLINNSGKILFKECLYSNETNSVKAEAMSVMALIKRCQLEKIKAVLIKTDCKTLKNGVNNEESEAYLPVRLLKELIRKIGFSLKWIGRNGNKIAHTLCESYMRLIKHGLETCKSLNLRSIYDFIGGSKDPIKSSKIQTVIKGKLNIKRKKPINMILNGINDSSTSQLEKDNMWNYYCLLISKNKRVSFETIMTWASIQQSINSKNGRRYLVEHFIVSQHDIQDLRKVKNQPFEILKLN